MTASLTVAQPVSRVRIEQLGDLLNIRYDLLAPRGKSYDIHPVIMTRDGRSIQPMSLSGDSKAVMPGRDRMITWQVLRDMPALEGEVAVVLEAREVLNPPVLSSSARESGGGPSNAFLSIILPGLGDVFVNEPGATVKVKPIYIMTAYVSSLGLANYARIRSDENYQAYLRSAQQYEMNHYYDQAVYFRENARFFALLAGAIWVADVARVAIKGASNRKGNAWHADYILKVKGGCMDGKPSVSLACKF